eukprot:UN28884
MDDFGSSSGGIPEEQSITYHKPKKSRDTFDLEEIRENQKKTEKQQEIRRKVEDHARVWLKNESMKNKKLMQKFRTLFTYFDKIKMDV